MEKITKLSADLKASEDAKKSAHKEFKLAKAEYKKAVNKAEKNFIAADRARAKANAEHRLARKAHRDEQDRITIEKAEKAKAVK